jgi:hypothetical protein
MLRIRSRGSLSFADDNVAEVTLREPAQDIAPTPSALAAGLTSATVGHELRAALGIAPPTLSAGRSRPCHEARFPVRTCVRRPVATLEVGCPTTCLSRTNGGAEVVLLLDALKMTQDGLKRHETAVAELERQRRATAKALGGLGRARLRVHDEERRRFAGAFGQIKHANLRALADQRITGMSEALPAVEVRSCRSRPWTVSRQSSRPAEPGQLA